MVIVSYTVVDPRTMMIHFQYTTPTCHILNLS